MISDEIQQLGDLLSTTEKDFAETSQNPRLFLELSNSIAVKENSFRGFPEVVVLVEGRYLSPNEEEVAFLKDCLEKYKENKKSRAEAERLSRDVLLRKKLRKHLTNLKDVL